MRPLVLPTRKSDCDVEADKSAVLTHQAISAVAIASGVIAAWQWRRKRYKLRLFAAPRPRQSLCPRMAQIRPRAFFSEPIIERLVVHGNLQSRDWRRA